MSVESVAFLRFLCIVFSVVYSRKAIKLRTLRKTLTGKKIWWNDNHLELITPVELVSRSHFQCQTNKNEKINNLNAFTRNVLVVGTLFLRQHIV